MKVKLRQVWFSPEGGRLRPNKVHEVPDAWAKQLPRPAEVVEPPRAPLPQPAPAVQAKKQ
jgi:hypothetical protein